MFTYLRNFRSFRATQSSRVATDQSMLQFFHIANLSLSLSQLPYTYLTISSCFHTHFRLVFSFVFCFGEPQRCSTLEARAFAQSDENYADSRSASERRKKKCEEFEPFSYLSPVLPVKIFMWKWDECWWWWWWRGLSVCETSRKFSTD